MVVLAVAVLTKSGKALVSRQFVEMTRIRIEGLLAAFPKLIGSDTKQHTFVETESVRYVYQPLESLYLLLITNRASNIVEDLDTLRLVSKVVPEIAGSANNINEEKITENHFELIFAFDELIAAGGYREAINLQQIRTNMEMESHEEKLHLMIKTSKVEAARDQAKEAAKVIKERQKESGKMAGIGSGPSYDTSYTSTSGYDRSHEPITVESPKPSFTESKPKSAPVKGMSLSSKAKNQSLEDALAKEDRLAPLTSSRVSQQAAAHQEVAVQPAIQFPVTLVIQEKVSANMTRDGNIELHEVKGSLTLTALSDEVGLCNVQMKLGRNVGLYTFNTHPKLNKPVFDKSGLLTLKDTTKGFPSARPVGILKWTYSGTADEHVPLKINCWPEEEGRGQMNVSIEYTMDQPITLHNVEIRIPLGTAEHVNIVNIDGTYRQNNKDQELIWEVQSIDHTNASGSLEFTIHQKNSDAFFPIQVSFSSQELFCNIDVVNVTTVNGDAPIQYGLTKAMSTEEYIIA